MRGNAPQVNYSNIQKSVLKLISHRGTETEALCPPEADCVKFI